MDFGKFDREKSETKLEKIEGGTWKLFLRPIDNNGNLLGPDQLKNFNLELKKGKVLKEIDNGDGSYEFTFKVNAKNPIFQFKYKNRIWIKQEKLR